MAGGIVLAGLAALPLPIVDVYTQNLIIITLLFAGLSQAWNILGGNCGQISLSHVLYLRLLMLDERRQGIALRLVDDILAAVASIRDLGVTVLLVEQRLAEALDLADRAHVLRTGRVVMSGPANDIAADDGVRRASPGM